jgi:hypothetical protein
MIEMTTAATKEKAAPKAAAAKKTAPAFASFEMPAAFREFAEKGVMQAKEAYDSYKSMAEEATDAIEDTFATMNKGATDFQAKQFDTFTTQAKEIQDLASKVQVETTKPLKDSVAKAMTQWKTSI